MLVDLWRCAPRPGNAYLWGFGTSIVLFGWWIWTDGDPKSLVFKAVVMTATLGLLAAITTRRSHARRRRIASTSALKIVNRFIEERGQASDLVKVSDLPPHEVNECYDLVPACDLPTKCGDIVITWYRYDVVILYGDQDLHLAQQLGKRIVEMVPRAVVHIAEDPIGEDLPVFRRRLFHSAAKCVAVMVSASLTRDPDKKACLLHAMRRDEYQRRSHGTSFLKLAPLDKRGQQYLSSDERLARFSPRCLRSTEDVIEGLATSVFNLLRVQYRSCFISHSSDDQEFAIAVCQALQDYGVPVWLAPKQMRPGDSIPQRIDDAVQHHAVTIVVLSPTVRKSQWVEFELRSASRHKRDIIPISIVKVESVRNWDWTILDPETGRDLFKDYILGRHIGDFSTWKTEEGFSRALDELLSSLNM